MFKKLFFLAFFIFSVNSLASVSVIENSENRIVVKITFDSIFYDENFSIPIKFVNFTADKNSKPQISVSSQNRIVKKIPKTLEKYTNSPVLEYFPARNIPVFSVGVSPVLSINNNEIVYTTSVILTITYEYGQRQNPVPKTDYYNSISASLLNPDKIKYTILKDERTVLRSIRDFDGISDKALRFSIGDPPSAGNYNECDLSQKAGIYRIKPSDLLQIGSGLSINLIKIRASNPNVANDTTPSFTNLPSGLVNVPLVIRDKNRDGIFNGDDEILFYGEKIHRWVFDENSKEWNFSFNCTDYNRYYWITIEVPDIMQKFVGENSSSSPRTSGDVYFHGKRSGSITTVPNPTYGHGDKKWIWKNLRRENTSLSIEFPSSFVDSKMGEQSRVRLFTSGYPSYQSGNSSFSTFNPIFDLKIGSRNFLSQYTEKWVSFQNDSIMDFSIKAKFPVETGNPNVDFESYDLHYKQELSMKKTKNLQFYSEESKVPSPVSYKISNIPADDFHLFVRHNPKTQETQLIDSSSTGDVFQFFDRTANGYKYHFATSSGFLSLPSNKEIIPVRPSNDSWRITKFNMSNQADYLIVAPEIFLQQAIELAKHKYDTGRFVAPKVVCLEDIFNVFSGGVFEPAAIRNFMVYVQNAWQESPQYLVLFGRGHYDYKKINYSQQNFIPVYIATADAFHKDLVSYPVEDFFAYTVEGSVVGKLSAFPQLFVGRIPVNSIDEANAYLRKIKALEGNGADYSFWRNRPLLIGDDDITNDLNENEKNMFHTYQSDSIGIIIDNFDRASDIRKVTLFEFPFDNQIRKPLARNSIIREINNGVCVVNYFGHGSFTTLSDQRIFDNNDISSLTNLEKYFVFGAFSCSVGFFDHPATFGLSELLVRTANKGAIAAISSTRTAYSNENGWIAYNFYNSFYDTSQNVSIGQAFLESKASQGTNLLTFALLGDPSYKPLPKRENITDIKILDKNRTEIDTLQKMQNVIISAKLPITNDEIQRTAEIILQNPENLSPSRKDGLSFPLRYPYRLPGMIVSRVSKQFSGNYIEIPITIPPTVIDMTLGSRIKIHVSEKNSDKIYSGAKEDGFVFNGYDISNIDTSDHVGPAIAVRRFFSDSLGKDIDTTANKIVGNKIVIDGFNKKSGIAYLEILISDKSGVDIFSSQSLGGGVSVSIERIREKRQYGQDDLTLKNDDFRSISLLVELSKNEFPAVGEYELTISARDILQNITTQRYILDIKSLKNEQYTIGDLFCYPSPVSMGQKTTFYFNKPIDNVEDISLKIYTLSGKLVRSFPNAGRERAVVWDLTDQKGRKLSPNVYLYRLFVKRYKREDDSYQSFGDKTEIIKSNIKKLVIYPPK